MSRSQDIREIAMGELLEKLKRGETVGDIHEAMEKEMKMAEKGLIQHLGKQKR